MTGGDSGWLSTYSPENVSEEIGVTPETILHVGEDFSHSNHALAIGGGSAAAHSNGYASVKAIFSLNHVADNVGKKGGVILNPDSPIGGLEAAPSGNSFAEFQRLTEDMQSGTVKVLMVRGADLFYGLPDTSGFKGRSANVPMIVSFGGMMDDTTSMADLILPEHHYLEDWGTDIPLAGVGYELVGFQQPVVRPFFEDRGDNLGTKGFGDVLLAIAQVMQMDLGLNADTFKEVIRESARELYALRRGSINAPTFEAFWNGVLQRGGWWLSLIHI